MALNLTVLAPKALFEDLSSPGIVDALENVLSDHSPIFFKEDGHEIVADGEDQPELVLQIAEQWDQKILDRAVRAVENWQKAGKELNSTASYNLRLAIMAADNYFGPGVEKAVVVDEEYFRPMLGDLLTDVKEHPEEFVIIDVAYDF